jgi:hypothetical protein
MHDFKIDVVREGRWWMVYVPEIDGVTQARRLSEVETMAREYIALDQNIPYDDIQIETAGVRLEDPAVLVGGMSAFRDLLDAARQIRNQRAHARQVEAEAQQQSREYALWLTTYGIPVRDVAELLDVSPQRVSQLANEQPDTQRYNNVFEVKSRKPTAVKKVAKSAASKKVVKDKASKRPSKAATSKL